MKPEDLPNFRFPYENTHVPQLNCVGIEGGFLEKQVNDSC